MKIARSKFIIAALAALSISVQAEAQTANGRATTAAPTYTNNTSAPLSLDTSGNLRVVNSGSPTGTQDVQGNVASGATDSGNPVKIGGVYNTTLPTLTDGQRGNAQMDSRANLFVSNSGGNVTGADNYSNADTLYMRKGDNTGLGLFVVGGYYFDGTTWDRARGDSTNGALVNLGTNNDVTVSSLPSIPAGANAIGSVSVSSLPALPTGANTIGAVNVNGTVPVSLATNVPVPATNTAGTSNFSAILATSTNSTLVKGSAGTVYEISTYNTSATPYWLKMYNTSSAPTCGSGTPVARYLIPASADGSGAGSNINISLGKSFTTGIGFCVTAAIGDPSTAPTTASTGTVNITYK